MNDFDNKQICSYKDIDRFGFTCDVCGRKVNGCHYINGMSFCEKCYQETFGKDNQQNEIQQIKQQLEEKDQQIKKRVMVYEKQFIVQTNEIYSLKQQLAEKQNTINEINKEFVQAVHDWKTLCAEKDKEIERLKVFEKAYYFNQLQASQKDIQQFQQLANQSAVNINHIAITELKKVKEKINKLPITDILDTDYGGFKKIYQTDAIRIIDQQINELKGESK